MHFQHDLPLKSGWARLPSRTLLSLGYEKSGPGPPGGDFDCDNLDLHHGLGPCDDRSGLSFQGIDNDDGRGGLHGLVHDESCQLDDDRP